MWLCLDVNLWHGSGVYTRCVCTTFADKEANKILSTSIPEKEKELRAQGSWGKLLIVYPFVRFFWCLVLDNDL
jgi:hypothetical protein